MEKKRIVAEFIDPGECPHYSRGQKFVLDTGFKPAGFCDSGYIAVSRAAETLIKANKLPGPDSNKILTQCSRRHGAIWEVRLEEIAEPERLDNEIDIALGKLENGYAKHCKNR